MEIEEAFTAYLLGRPGLVALVGQRFFPEEIPQGSELPAVSYIKISDVKDHTLTGQSEIERPVFQFTAFAFTKAAARAVGNQLKAALQDYVGVMSGIKIQKIELLNEMSNLEKSPDGTVKVYTEDQEYEITFERS